MGGSAVGGGGSTMGGSAVGGSVVGVSAVGGSVVGGYTVGLVHPLLFTECGIIIVVSVSLSTIIQMMMNSVARFHWRV